MHALFHVFNCTAHSTQPCHACCPVLPLRLSNACTAFELPSMRRVPDALRHLFALYVPPVTHTCCHITQVHNGDAVGVPSLVDLHPNGHLMTLSPHVQHFVEASSI